MTLLLLLLLQLLKVLYYYYKQRIIFILEPKAAEPQHFNRNHDNRGHEARGRGHNPRQNYSNLEKDRATADAQASGAAKPPRKREFDRRPANGAHKGMKKGGFGTGNWGDNKNPANVVKDEESAEVVASTETVADATAEPVVEEAAPVVEEEVDNTLTLEQHLKNQEAKRCADDLEREIRRAGESNIAEDDFQNAVEYEGAEDNSDILGGVSHKKSSTKTKTAPTVNKISLDEFTSHTSTSAYRGRGGQRGSYRGRGGRGGRNTVNVNDSHAFPALGK